MNRSAIKTTRFTDTITKDFDGIFVHSEGLLYDITGDGYPELITMYDIEQANCRIEIFTQTDKKVEKIFEDDWRWADAAGGIWIEIFCNPMYSSYGIIIDEGTDYYDSIGVYYIDSYTNYTYLERYYYIEYDPDDDYKVISIIMRDIGGNEKFITEEEYNEWEKSLDKIKLERNKDWKSLEDLLHQLKS